MSAPPPCRACDLPPGARVDLAAVRSRFAFNLLVLLAAVMMVGERFAFAPVTAAWLIFGEACLITAVVLAAFPVRGRGTPQRLLGFAEGGACALLAIIGLVAHEALMERGVVVIGGAAGRRRARG